MNPFSVIHPESGLVPIIVSVPHCGHLIPDDLAREFRSDKIKFIDDTDWFVDRLYGFAPSMGMTLVSSVVSRWVIDLNRPPDGKPLYNDGRVITGLCPVTDFLGDPIYADCRLIVSQEETERRKSLYYHPYHEQLKALIAERDRKSTRLNSSH